jgi:RNA polymerase primary sigma factor
MQQVGAMASADASLVALVLERARAEARSGQVERSSFEELLREVHLPARLYRSAVQAISSSGLALVETMEEEPAAAAAQDEAVIPLDAPEPPDPGWEQNGLDHLIARNPHQILSAAEERALGVEVQRGLLAEEALREDGLPPEARRHFERVARSGKRAQDRLISCNLRLVLSIVHKHRRQATPGMDFDDLFQEGILGLQRAIVKFDPDRGFKLSTYATWWIRQSLTRAIADHGRSVRIPVHMWEQVRKVWAVGAELGSANRPASAKAIADFLDMPVEKVRDIQRVGRAVDSLDRPTPGGRSTVGDLVSAPAGADPAEVVEARQLAVVIDEMLSGLTDRERELVVLRYGLEDGQKRTLEEVGEIFGVTRERIRQIEAKVLSRLRSSPQLDGLADFVDFRSDLDGQLARDMRRKLGKRVPPSERASRGGGC